VPSSAVSPLAQLRYDPVQLLGVVTEMHDGRICTVRCAGKDWLVERAASCLLAPAVGDEVMIAGPVPDQVYLIAIIRQADSGLSRLDMEGDVRITSSTGDISLTAPRALILASGERLEMESLNIGLQARTAQCGIEELDYIGGRANFAVATLTWVGAFCEIVVDRITQVAQSVLRLTRDTEQVRAGHLDYEAEHAARLHARHTLVTAKNLVKVDADQIHMG